MNGRRKLVLANRRNLARADCATQFRRMSRTMLPCRRSYNMSICLKRLQTEVKTSLNSMLTLVANNEYST